MIMMIGWLLGGQVLPTMTPHQPAVAYWVVAVPCAAAFMAALLAHELAHSLVARRYGVPVTSITLWALGGVSELGGEPSTARADLRIAAAGGGQPGRRADLRRDGRSGARRGRAGYRRGRAGLAGRDERPARGLRPAARAPLDGRRSCASSAGTGDQVRAAIGRRGWPRHRRGARRSPASARLYSGPCRRAVACPDRGVRDERGRGQGHGGNRCRRPGRAASQQRRNPGPGHRRHLDDRRRLHRLDRPGLGAVRVSVISPGGSLAGVTGVGELGQVPPAAGPAPRWARSWPGSRPATWLPPMICTPRCSAAHHWPTT